jgi:hypothetical protein
LFENPEFQDVLRYSPYKVYKNEDGTNREYEHICLPKRATLAPIILSSDKTNLTRFSGNKVVWPVYLSIGNIEKATRRQPTARQMVLEYGVHTGLQTRMLFQEKVGGRRLPIIS